jgi:ferrous iron transport protein B
MKKPVIAIAGNPNCGKSSVFNLLTGARQSVGNWPGVTVDKKVGEITSPLVNASLVDLPGIYSLNAWSEDERIARDYLLSNEAALVINVLDSANLERNLYLTRQLQEMGVPLLVVLNMEDIAKHQGIVIDIRQLSKELGAEVVSVSAVHKVDAALLERAVARALEHLPDFQPRQFSLPDGLREEVELLTPVLQPLAQKHPWKLDWIALKVLEGDPQFEELCVRAGLLKKEQLAESRLRIATAYGLQPDEWLADLRYRAIEDLLARSGNHTRDTQLTWSDRVDRIVTHRLLGFPIFLLAMYAIFWTTINLGGAFIDFFDIAFGALFVDGVGAVLTKIGAPEVAVTIIASGIGAGIQTLSTFFPIIFVLFFIIALLESSGYMARAAFVMDRLMRVIGLPGKAFIPMLVGFGCTVPAIMATRSLENKRDRILSVFMVPFMSCGARLPVYVLFAAAFFPGQGQNLVFGLYLVGIVLAILTGLLLKGTVYQGTVAPFVLELPRYHRPRLFAAVRSAGFRLRAFIKKGGKVLIPIIAVLGVLNSIGTDGSFGNEDSENSVLSAMGKSVTPVFSPMGVQEDNWPAAVGLFTGLFAKEAIVGTLNSLYAQENAKAAQVAAPAAGTNAEAAPAAEEEFSLSAALLEALGTIPENLKGLGETLTDPLGINVGEVQANEASASELDVDAGLFATMRAFFHNSTAAAIAYLLFVLLYIPCLVAVSATWKEVGPALTVLQMYYATILGWTLSTATYQILEGGSMGWIVFSAALLAASIVGIVLYAKKTGRFAG